MTGSVAKVLNCESKGLDGEVFLHEALATHCKFRDRDCLKKLESIFTDSDVNYLLV